jgi:hypothetical protein
MLIQGRVDSALLLKQVKQEVMNHTTRIEYDGKVGLGDLKKK